MSLPNLPTTWLEINLGAIVHNISVIRKRLRPKTRIMLVLKADAYGHGISEVAACAASCGIDAFAVAGLEEGVKIRRAGIDGTIMLLNPPELSESWLKVLLAERIEPMISTEVECRFLQEFCSSHNVVIPVHLKIDTGMSRLGVRYSESVTLAHALSDSPHLQIASVFSHLAGCDNGEIERQAKRFRETVDILRSERIDIPVVHLAHSGATIRKPNLHFDQVRIGLALYGVSPSNDDMITGLLQPAMSLKSRILHIKTVPQGEGVSYCPQFTATRNMKIGVLGAGYANGILRSLSGKIGAIVRGRIVPQIGTITMNHLIVDLSELPDIAVGETATLLGTEGNIVITIDQMARNADTIPWEILCLFGNANPKIYF